MFTVYGTESFEEIEYVKECKSAVKLWTGESTLDH